MLGYVCLFSSKSFFGEVGAVKLGQAPQLFITDRSKAVVFCGSLLPVFGVRVDVSPYVF